PKVAPPPVVAGETEDRPAPQRPAPAPAEEAGPPTPLARTGPSDLLLVLGGCGLALGGLAVMGAHRRPRTGR
ncbi:MAG: hypothetical protein ACRDY7_06670, partial [Acidimicrobiia bacterium]